MRLVPNSAGFPEPDRFREFNTCHNPAGPGGGQFCSDRGPLTYYPYPEHSTKIPAYLKADVARAARAGILTVHQQQPEPVIDSTGKMHDPLALSHAQSGEQEFSDKATGMWVKMPTGKIRIMTRGGEYEPTENVYTGSFGGMTRRTKTLKPEDLPEADRATVDDIVSTYRHEVGHLMDKVSGWSRRDTASTPAQLGAEVRAWTHAVEISPDHRVSERMVIKGLTSHAYHEFRVQGFMKSDYGKTVASYDRREWAERQVKFADQNGIDPPTLARAEAFAARVAKTLKTYGQVLARKRIVKVPRGGRRSDPWFGTPKQIWPGPGSGRVL